MEPVQGPAAPIGVFDSGVGGLTVLAALLGAMPGEDYLYLGDTARLPYGTKSAATVVRYALQAADQLVERGVKALVVACNTASAVALEAMRERYGQIPVLGVIEPGAAAACRATRSARIAVLATEGTVRGGAYQRAIAAHCPGAIVRALACPLFVALAEEGWTEGPVAAAAVHRYLQALWADGQPRGDTLVLGCTHFPLLAALIAEQAGPDIQIIDSAHTTALVTRERLAAAGRLRATPGLQGAVQLLATDNVARFAAVGSRFLRRPIDAGQVELIDL